MGFEMWKIKEFWNDWDKFAVAAHIIGIIVTAIFTIFVITLISAKVTCENPPKLNLLPGSLVRNFSSADEELEG